MKLLEIPRPLLYAGILVFATLGAYAAHGSTVELLVLTRSASLGFLMRRFDFPVAPAILGVILGPLMEPQFRRTLIANDGDLGARERPFAVALLVLAILALVVPYLPVLVARLRRRPRPAAGRLAFGEGD